jgi:hypothetical protein
MPGAFYVHRLTACIGLIAWAEGFGLQARRANWERWCWARWTIFNTAHPPSTRQP